MLIGLSLLRQRGNYRALGAKVIRRAADRAKAKFSWLEYPNGIAQEQVGLPIGE